MNVTYDYIYFQSLYIFFEVYIYRGNVTIRPYIYIKN